VYVCLAHIHGHRHKKKLASLRKQAKLIPAAKTDDDQDQSLVDEQSDAVVDSYVADNVDELTSD